MPKTFGPPLNCDNTGVASFDCRIYQEPLPIITKPYEKSIKVKGEMTKYWTRVSLFFLPLFSIQTSPNHSINKRNDAIFAGD